MEQIYRENNINYNKFGLSLHWTIVNKKNYSYILLKTTLTLFSSMTTLTSLTCQESIPDQSVLLVRILLILMTSIVLSTDFIIFFYEFLFFTLFTCKRTYFLGFIFDYCKIYIRDDFEKTYKEWNIRSSKL